MNNNGIPSSPAHVLIAKLALQLHQQGENEQRISLPLGVSLKADDLPPGTRLIDDQLDFLNIAARNEIIAEAAFGQLPALSTPNVEALFDAAHELWRDEIGHADQVAGRLLALAADRLDILAAGADLIRMGSSVYNVLHLIEAAIPYLKSIDPKSVIDLLTTSHTQTHNDLAGNPTFGALETWLGTKPSAATALRTEALLSLSEETKVLLVITTLALSQSDYLMATEVAREDCESQVNVRAEAGMWALGRLLLIEDAPVEPLHNIEATIRDAINADREELKRHALAAATGAMHKRPAFDLLLEQLAEQGNQDVLAFVARVLFIKSKQMSERGLNRRWLQLLTRLKPEFVGPLRDLDFAMSRLLTVPENVEIVVSTLAEWVENFGQKAAVDSRSAELFDDTARALFRNDEQRPLFVTEWLLSNQIALPRVLAGFLNQIDNGAMVLRLHKGCVDRLSASELLFLARRLLGYIHDRNQLTTLALSLLESNEAEQRIYPLLKNLLVAEIGYDYPASTIEALNAAAQTSTSKSDKEFLLNAVGDIERELATRSSLPSLNELQPPLKLRRLFARARGKQMEASMERAQEKSIFRQMATHIPIKAGASAVNSRDSNFDRPLKLSTISYSIELPRREAFDPIGNAIRHYEFRNAKKGVQ